MTESSTARVNRRDQFASELQWLTQERGLRRDDRLLLDLLGTKARQLQAFWGVPTDDPKAARRVLEKRLRQLIRQLPPRPGLVSDKDFYSMIEDSFNCGTRHELHALILKDRQEFLEHKYVISNRTVRRYLEEVIDQMAEILASSDFRPVAIAEALGSPDMLAFTPAAEQAMPPIASFLDRLISLSDDVQIALNAARESCIRQARAFYASDLLLAILDLPGSRVAACFDELEQDWRIKVRNKLLAMPDPRERKDPYMSFDWPQRDDVRRAWRYALEDGLSGINELHLLLAVMDSTVSETNVWLRRFLGEDYGQLRATVQRMRRDGPPQIRTPTPG